MLKVIGGEFRGRKLFSPKGSSTRPTQGHLRETLFNIVQNEIEGSVFLDLFAGSGAVGIEALSRGSGKAIFVENDQMALSALNKNIELLGVKSKSQLISRDVYSALKSIPKHSCDLIFADPPYNQGHGEKLLELLSQYEILAPSGRLFIEEGGLISQDSDHFELVRTKKLGGTVLHEYRLVSR